jgi:aminoglycoside phosphotransferase (APT) family kinase protein
VFDLNDLTRIGVELNKIFPALGVVTPIHVLGSGFNSIALETAEGLAFRIAKNELAAEGYRKEARFLPAVATQIAVPIPNPQWYAASADAFPFGVIGYRKLIGKPMQADSVTTANRRELVASLAGFMLALHRVPLASVAGLSRSKIRVYAALRDSVLPPLRERLTAAEYTSIVHWWDRFLVDAELWKFAPALCHGDLWYENILVDDEARQMTGVLDFENMAIGDPALDFVALLYLGDAFVGEVIQAYRAAGGAVGENFLHRLNLLWGLREFGGVQYSLRFNDEEEMTDSVEKIRQGPILTPCEFRL